MLTRRQLFAISLAVASVAAALALDNGLALYISPPPGIPLSSSFSLTPELILFFKKTTTKTKNIKT
jgi:hypothetical protein